MILKDKEIVTILKHACSKFVDLKDITIVDMDVDIGSYITLEGKVNYYGVDSKVKVIAKIECQPTTIKIFTRGIIKYGFITLDFNKMMKEYLKDNAYLQVTKEGILIKNEYVKTIRYGEGQIEIELS